MSNSSENTLITRTKIVLTFLFAACFSAPLIIVFFNIFQRTISHPQELSYFISLPFLKKLYNSSILSLTTSVTAILFGSLIAFTYFTLKTKWLRSGIWFLSLIIFSVSPVIYLVALTRYHLFNLLPVFLQIVIVLTLNLSPLPFAILVFTFGAIAKSSLDVAFLGAPPISVFKKITLPQLFTPLTISGLMIFMLVFTHEEIPSFLGFRTYSEEFLNRIVVMSDTQQVSIFSLPFLVLGFLIVIFLTWVISKSHLRRLVENYYPPTAFTFRSRKKFLLAPILLTIIFPVILSKLIEYKDISLFLKTIFENSKDIENSLFFSVLSAGIGTSIACCFYNFFKRYNTHVISMLGIAILLLYWLLPSSLTALGLIEITHLFNADSNIFDILILLAGYQIYILPIAVFVLCGLQLIRKEQDKTIFQCIEIPKSRIFTKITVPQKWSIWLLTATILSIFVLNELSITVLLIPPGIETLVIKIYNLMHYGDYSLVGLLSLTQILVVSVLVLLTATVIMKKSYSK